MAFTSSLIFRSVFLADGQVDRKAILHLPSAQEMVVCVVRTAVHVNEDGQINISKAVYPTKKVLLLLYIHNLSV
jgi:hypothetical protein